MMIRRSARSQNLTCTHFLSPARRSGVLINREVRYESSIGSIAGDDVPCGSGATRRHAGWAHARGSAIGRLVARMGSVSQLGAIRFTRQGPFLALAQCSHTLWSARTMVWSVPVRLCRRSVLPVCQRLQPRLLPPGADGKSDEQHGDARPTTAAASATVTAVPADGQRADRRPRGSLPATG